jgi:hypothetical protein
MIESFLEKKIIFLTNNKEINYEKHYQILNLLFQNSRIISSFD